MRAKINHLDSTYFTKELRIAGPWRIGSVTVTTTGTELNLLHGALFSTTEANYLQGVTSSIQTQINAKASLANPTFTGILKLSTTDTMATQAYARSQGGGGGSMTYPGAGIALSTGSAWSTSITNNSSNWNTAYSDRMKWDGGATGLTPATGRTSLGATTIGSAFFTLSNPSLVTFPRINADNTVTARLASELKADLSLDNVTNESKSTMFTSPTFTGTATIPSPFTLGSVSVTSTGTQLNYLSGTSGTTGTGNVVLSAAPTITGHPTIEGVTSTGATGTGNLVFSASPAFTGSVPTSGGIPLGRITSITGTFTAGVLSDITLTGVTTKPYNIMIQTTAGKDITSAVSDSLAFTGGVYHLHVYSVDLITDAEIKVTH